MQLFEVHRMRLACIVQAISSSTRKDLASSKRLRQESPIRPSANGQNGRSTEGAPIEKAGEVLWFCGF
jgi:hypothetical protein